MFKIGEFSKLTQVSIRMLRYYDEAGLLKAVIHIGGQNKVIFVFNQCI